MMSENKFDFFCSWSGGKDSCLTLHRMLSEGHTCRSLFTMIDETGQHSRSHGLPPEALTAQADSMGINLETSNASWGDYESQFSRQTKRFQTMEILHGAFGDIDLIDHRKWVERVCSKSSITPHLPLWQEDRRKLVDEFINAGFKAVIVVVNTDLMPEHFLGRNIDIELADELEKCGVDASGENGEFHTFVYGGPIFKRDVLFKKGEITQEGSYQFLPITVLSG